MIKRIKPKIIRAINSRSDMEKTVGEIVRLQLEQNEIKVQMDREIDKVRKQYEGKIDSLDQEINNKLLVAEDWARNNPDEFGKRKSIEFNYGVAGFRTGTPKVTKGRKFRSLKEATIAMMQIAWAKKYIKESDPSINKELLIADRGKLTVDQLNQIGLSITQEETFFITPKTEKLEQGISVA